MTDNGWKEKFRSLLLAVEKLNGRMSVSVNCIDTVCSVHVQRISEYQNTQFKAKTVQNHSATYLPQST